MELFDRVMVHREKTNRLFLPTQEFKCWVFKDHAWASTMVSDVMLSDAEAERKLFFSLLERDLASELSKHL